MTQRGNRRQKTFCCEDDYEAYPELTAERWEEGVGGALKAVEGSQGPGVSSWWPWHGERDLPLQGD